MKSAGHETFARVPARWRRLRAARPRTTLRRAHIWRSAPPRPVSQRVERRLGLPLFTVNSFCAFFAVLTLALVALGAV